MWHYCTHSHGQYNVYTRIQLSWLWGCASKKRTSMSFQYLQYLTGLQVPNKNLGIFTSTHYIFSSGSAEAGRKTVCAVGVSGIGLHTARCVIIPQANSRILSGCEHKFRIRRELNVRTGMITMCTMGKALIIEVRNTNQIGLSSSTRVFKHWPESASQIRLLTIELKDHWKECYAYINPSIAHETIRVPSWLKLTAVTGSEWAGRTFKDLPTRNIRLHIQFFVNSFAYLLPHPTLAQSRRIRQRRGDLSSDWNLHRIQSLYAQSGSSWDLPSLWVHVVNVTNVTNGVGEINSPTRDSII